MRLIDADAFASEMKERQDSCEKWMDEAEDDEVYFRAIGAFGALSETKLTLDKMPTIDAVEIVRCKDCIYWQKEQIKLSGGSYRDYNLKECESELFGLGVTSDVGINIGSFCMLYNRNHINRIPQFMSENDFCSKGKRKDDGERRTE